MSKNWLIGLFIALLLTEGYVLWLQRDMFDPIIAHSEIPVNNY